MSRAIDKVLPPLSPDAVRDFVAAGGKGDDAAILEFLHEHGAGSVDVKGENGMTALMQAVWFKRYGTVSLLLQNGADINERNDAWQTPLIMGSWFGADEELVAMLLKNGARINERDIEGDTALILAAAHRQTAAVRVLLEKGADLDIRNDEGKTALMKALVWQNNQEEWDKGFAETASLLQQVIVSRQREATERKRLREQNRRERERKALFVTRLAKLKSRPQKTILRKSP